MQYDYWSIPRGRISRRVFLKRFLILFVLGFILLILFEEFGDETWGVLFVVPAFYIGALMCIQYIKRLHDVDASGWWCILGLIPYVSWILILFLLLMRGDPKPNRYGPPPVKKSPSPPAGRSKRKSKLTKIDKQ